MTPERATAIFRALLETPVHEIDQVPRRTGLTGNPTKDDLEHMREILRAMVMAIQSGPGPNWDPVTTAWAAIVTRHGHIQESAMGPAPPQWVRSLPPKPGLGDPAPGAAGYGTPQAYAAPAPAAAWGTPPPPPPPVPPQPQYAAPQPQYAQAYAQPYAQPHAQAPQAGQRRVAKTDPGTPALQAAAAPAHMHAAATTGAAATAQYYAHTQQPAQAPPPPQPQQPTGYQPGRRVVSQPPPKPEPLGGPGKMEESVTKYAAFCAACAAAPDKVFVTMVEYGIASPEARQKMDELWQERFDDDAALQQQWEQLFTQFRDQLKAGA
jgi:hypothetical protein